MPLRWKPDVRSDRAARYGFGMGGGRVEQARLSQELSANALGQLVTQVVGGWRLRFSAGYTRRANSVLPGGDDGSLDLDGRIAEAERFYARRGLPARFQLSPAVDPPDLDAVLHARGYRMEAPTEVQVAPLAEVLGYTGAPAVEPSIEPIPSDGWLDTWSRVSGRTADRSLVRQVLEAVGPRAAYALLDDGRGPGATQLYLQVEAENEAARALYRRVGFRTAYRYHYRYRAAH
jgi:GNAT superfamily N-acetyltransferase